MSLDLRACQVSDEQLYGFVDGVEETLDEHVAGCDECQEFLAELWIGEPHADLVAPVIKRLRLEQFLIEAARLGFDIAARMGHGLATYTFGLDRQHGNGKDA